MRPAPGPACAPTGQSPACTVGVTPCSRPCLLPSEERETQPARANSPGNVQVVWREAPRTRRDKYHKLLWGGLRLWASHGLRAETPIVQILLSLLRSLVSPAGACPGGA